MKMLPRILGREKLILTIFASGLAVRIIFLSPWLEDWDSIQFALGLRNFDLAQHQPHPPGYPLYILLGKIVNLVFHNERVSLTFLSALLGTSMAIPFYILTRNMLSKRLALLATILLLVTPIHWLLSEVALSNIPGMFFTIVSATFIYKGKGSEKSLLLGGFLAGATLGIRFAEYSILLALLAFVLFYKRDWGSFLKSIAFFSVGVLSWLIPLIKLTGLQQFVNLYISQVDYIARHDSLIAFSSLIPRLLRIKELFIMGYSVYFVPLLLFIAWFLTRKFALRFKNTFILVWLLAYFIPLALVYNLEVPRHVLPLLPPLVLLTVSALERVKGRKLLMAVLVGTIVALFSKSLSEAREIHTLTPPTIAPVLYVKEAFDPKTTILITTFTYRQFQYYAPEFANFYGAGHVPELINAQYAITDFARVPEEAPALAHYRIVTRVNFAAPVEIFPRVPQTELYILEKN